MSLANIINVIGESYIDWKNVYYIIICNNKYKLFDKWFTEY